MGLNVSCHCDYCGNSLNEDHGADSYRIKVECEQLPKRKGIRFDVLIIPQLEECKYFCGIKCLYKWVEDELMRYGETGN